MASCTSSAAAMPMLRVMAAARSGLRSRHRAASMAPATLIACALFVVSAHAAYRGRTSFSLESASPITWYEP